MISTPPNPEIKPNQRRQGAKSTQTRSNAGTKKTTAQKSKRQTSKTQTSRAKSTKTTKSAASNKTKNPEVPLADVFTATATKGLVLLMIMAFNVITLRNSFLLVAPNMKFSGSIEIDALLYGFAMSVLMIIILFHEEDWNKAFCPGAVTLYVNTLVLILYMKWLDFVLGAWLAKWLLSGLLILMPVMGMFIVVVMLKTKK
ncbi:hypothetical protein BKI52_08100 [marine bacterium AO1-C]|nr:hypothetical protein BKI52_08100 [marine bacterium AO1-C]